MAIVINSCIGGDTIKDNLTKMQERINQPLSERLTISPAEAAILLGVSKPTIYQILNRDDCRAAFKVGTRTLVSVSALREWVNAHAGGAAVG